MFLLKTAAIFWAFFVAWVGFNTATVSTGSAGWDAGLHLFTWATLGLPPALIVMYIDYKRAKVAEKRQAKALTDAIIAARKVCK